MAPCYFQTDSHCRRMLGDIHLEGIQSESRLCEADMMAWQPIGTILCEIWIIQTRLVHHQSLWYWVHTTLYASIHCWSYSLQWRHNERGGVSNHWSLDCVLNPQIKETSKLGVTGLCEGNPLVTGGFPSQRASGAENVSIWWRHRVYTSIAQWAPWIKSNHSQAKRDGNLSCCP